MFASILIRLHDEFIHRADLAGRLDAELFIVQIGRKIILRKRLALARLDQRHHQFQMQPLVKHIYVHRLAANLNDHIMLFLLLSEDQAG